MEQLLQSNMTTAILKAVTKLFSPFISSSTNIYSDSYSNLSKVATTTTIFGSSLKPFTPIQPFTYAFQHHHHHNNHLLTADSLTTTRDDYSSEDDEENANLILEHVVCCCILIVFEAIQYIVLGQLRVSEKQHLRETFWDYFVQKSLFVFFILDASSNHERSSWAIWFTVLGSILLLSKLCRDRFEYLTSSPSTKRWPLIKISILMTFLLTTAIFCNIIIPITNLSTHTLFLLADASYVLTFVISVITRFVVLTYDMRPDSALERSASISYYTDLFFSMAMLSIELLHHMHLLIVSHTSIIIRAICLMKIHTLFMEIRRRYRRHKHYLIVLQLMETNFAEATPDEIENFKDECAICWDSMDTARKLPCGHLFHNSCLRSWLEQDTSCPTCRTSFKGQQMQQDDLIELVSDSSEKDDEEAIQSVPPHPRNHLFHFDSSRYTNNPLLRWLPTISIEGFI